MNENNKDEIGSCNRHKVLSEEDDDDDEDGSDYNAHDQTREIMREIKEGDKMIRMSQEKN